MKGEIKMLAIKKWFLDKNFNEGESYSIKHSDISIERETEKACYCKCVSEFGTIFTWIPKSCLTTKEEMMAEYDEAYTRFEAGEKRYYALLKFAKENHVKGVRKGLRKETIIAKIVAAGLEVPNLSI